MDWDSEIGWSDDFEAVDRYKSDHKISETVLKQRAIKRQIKNDQLALIVAKNLEALCSEPKPGEQWRIITEKAFNAFALIMHVLQTRKIKELYLAVYRINEPTVRTIIDKIKDGNIQKATFVISSFFNQTKKPERWAIMLKDFADASPKCRHVYTHNHAKIVAIRTSDNDYFVFEGSGNMSDNARIEQYIYENSKEMFEFHKKWMTQIAVTPPEIKKLAMRIAGLSLIPTTPLLKNVFLRLLWGQKWDFQRLPAKFFRGGLKPKDFYIHLSMSESKSIVSSFDSLLFHLTGAMEEIV